MIKKLYKQKINNNYALLCDKQVFNMIKKLYKQKINNNYALLCDLDNKCNLSMVKFKANPVRFIEFEIYL